MNKRILAVVPSVGEGDGVIKVYMNYYQELINDGYIIDFLIVDKETNSIYSNVIDRNGGKIYAVPKGKFKFDKERIRYIENVLDNNKYDIVHNNIPGPNGSIVLDIAKRKMVPIRIFHTHNPKNNLSLKSRITGAIFYERCISSANYLMACSKSAGQSVFGNREFDVLHNAINPRDYEFNEVFRERIKSQYNLENTTVIGTACRMEYQKNPFFLIDCFYEYNKRNSNSVLLWVGEGSLKYKLIDYIREKGIEDNVIFAGIQKDVGKWYSAMDLFILPSKFEGLGIVFLEAQANGLTCLGSNAVPVDTEITELMHRLPITDGTEKWCEEIEKLLSVKSCRKNYNSSFKMTGYDINYEKNKLNEIYNMLINTNERIR